MKRTDPEQEAARARELIHSTLCAIALWLLLVMCVNAGAQ